MSEPKTRRRFLIDVLFLGGALGAASQVQPFFSHFLEDQHPPEPQPVEPPPTAGPKATPRTPAIDCTEAYPSDSDVHLARPQPAVTKAYPSDSDLHSRVPVQPVPSVRGSKAPLWKRIGNQEPPVR
ncbi:microviridin/marinostatin family tricyclic proteinase inhibitor [bacterium]|nr:microviridin/marinostatin family tricyclic proteinase inhibitor [bacterium]